jgi:hypothetical protein
MILNSEVAAGCKVLRTALETAGYSSFVSEAVIEDLVTKVLVAARKERDRYEKNASNKAQPTPSPL